MRIIKENMKYQYHLDIRVKKSWKILLYGMPTRWLIRVCMNINRHIKKHKAKMKSVKKY